MIHAITDNLHKVLEYLNFTKEDIDFTTENHVIVMKNGYRLQDCGNYWAYYENSYAMPFWIDK